MANEETTIHRHKDKKANYCMLNNDIVNSPTLSFKAKALVWFLLAKPPKWKTSLTRLADTLPESKTAIRAALYELEEGGYIRWRKEKSSGATTMHVYETPRPNHRLQQDRESRKPHHKT